MIRFIDEHKDRRSGTLRWGIEPIAKVLGIAPSTYHAAKTAAAVGRARSVTPNCRPQILRVWEQNLAGLRRRQGVGTSSTTKTASGWPAAPSSG